MKIGYVRVSKADGSQVHDLQLDAMAAEGIKPKNIYADSMSGGRDDRPGLDACLKSLRSGDVLVVWKLDRLGRSLRHLVNTAHDLNERGVGFKVLEGEGAVIDTSTTIGKAMFGFFGIMTELERDFNRERTLAGLAAARVRGREGGRRHALSKSQVRQAQAAIGQPETVVAQLAQELGVSKPTLYRYVGPNGQLRDQGRAVLSKRG